MFPTIFRYAALVGAFLLPAPTLAQPGSDLPPAGSLIDEPCEMALAEPALARRLRCARLHVMRDPADPAAGRFEIAVAIRRSATPKEGAAPVLLLHGGPGGQMTRWIGMGVRDPAPGHDLVTFDMRGGGRSTPRVCDDAFSRLMAAFVHRDGPLAAAAERQRIVAECRAEFLAAGLDAQHFGTVPNVADAEALRQALGIERWLLLGESYGTTVAAHYLATHPGRIEAAVLDSLYPADEHILPTAEMQGRLVDRLAADCRADPSCAARFPDFGRAQLDAAVAALDAEPLVVGRGDARRLLDGLALRQLVMVVASFEAGARSLPLLVDAASRRDAPVLAGPLSMLSGSDDDAANLAAMLATDCRDRARHHAGSGMADPLTLLSGLSSSICGEWTRHGEAPRWPQPSAVPVLVLAGGYDSFQPNAPVIVAAMGDLAGLIEIPHAAHVARGAGACVRDLTSAFLAAPTASLETDCVATMQGPAFLTAVTALRGAVSTAQVLTRGEPPPAALLLAIGAALLSVVAALWAWIGRRRLSHMSAAAALPPAWMAGTVSLAAVLAPAVLLVSTDPMASAVLGYGLPAGWAWLPWLSLLPAFAGAAALLRGATRWSTRTAGTAAIACTLGLVIAGWSPIG